MGKIWTAALAMLALPGMVFGQSVGAFATFESASEAVLNDPHDLTFGPDGLLYIADKFGHRIVVMDPDTLEILSVFADGELPGVHDISFGPDGRAYAAVTGADVVAIFDMTGEEPERVSVIGSFPMTEGLLAHSNGQLYVMATGAGQVVAVKDNEIIANAGGLGGAHDVEEGHDGTIWVADNARARIVQFTPELEQIRTLEGPAYGFVGPRYLAVNDFGNLVVADQDAHRVLLINSDTGALLGVLGDGMPGIGPNKFDDPEGVAVRGSEYFISDSDNNRIVKYVVLLN